MDFTSDGRPVEYPDNPLTRIMSSRGGISATPSPSVKSSAWGNPVPISDEERYELDAKLAAMMDVAPPAEVAPPVQPMPRPVAQQRPRVNFNNIQRIDLEREVIIVDGAEFPLASEDVRQLRLLCVDCVLNAVVQGLREMLGQSGIETSTLFGALKEDVLGRGQETTQVPLGPGVPGEGAEPQDTVAEGE